MGSLCSVVFEATRRSSTYLPTYSISTSKCICTYKNCWSVNLKKNPVFRLLKKRIKIVNMECPNKVKVVLGAQWGDEGKGKLVDLLAEHADVVARCQGGNNAGHTVIVGDTSYDFHQAVDGLQESEWSENKKSLGTTKKGIGPTYSSKMTRNGVRISDLLGDFDKFSEKFETLADNYAVRFKSLNVDKSAELERYRKYAERLRPLVTETVSFIHSKLSDGKNVLVEGANAAMLDIDFGTYPYVTSSNCSIGGVCTGLGIPPRFIGDVYGVVKAYTTRVGDGPFPTEQLNDIGEYLQKIGREVGVTTGRKRRCGWIDIPLLKYTSMVNGYSAIALTKLDILDDLDEIQVGINYKKYEKPMEHFPSCEQEFDGVSVEYTTLPGWKTSIAKCTKFENLPENAKLYVKTIEEHLQIPVKWIGVGPSRDAIIER